MIINWVKHMAKKYIIKTNQKLFTEWMDTSASPTSLLGMYGAAIVQNDMEMTSEMLNEWYHHAGDLIDETEKEFAKVIEKMKDLRLRTVKYINSSNE